MLRSPLPSSLSSHNLPENSLSTASTLPLRLPPVNNTPTAVGQGIMQTAPLQSDGVVRDASERDPLLGDVERTKKPFHRARPLWIVPFVIAASIARGMTLAPRVEVFIQLSCDAIHGHLPIDYNHTSLHLLMPSRSDHTYTFPSFDRLNSLSTTMFTTSDAIEPEELDPMHLPTKQCLSDPAVQAEAARLQTIMTTTMGALSALTSGWWGHFGERHGRTRVLAAATLGLLLTDLMFILVSTPHSPFSSHGHKLLIVAPIIEGLLGGWSTLQGATSAYISDCTSDGSRAHIFSRFTGVFYLGFALGPALGAFLIRHPPPFPFLPAQSTLDKGQTITPVFWVAMLCSLVNLFLVAFVFPESLSASKRAVRREVEAEERKTCASATVGSFLWCFVAPLMVFAPKVRDTHGAGRRRDWSITFLALALFAYMLSLGLFQLKYLYAEHVYGWGAEQLSYYISLVGGARAVHLLFVLPLIISTFKPKSTAQALTSPITNSPAITATQTGKRTKPKQTKAHLAAEISFDLILARISFFTDLLSHTLVSLSSTASTAGSQGAFIGFTLLACFGSGVVPAIQSLALCVLHDDDKEDAMLGDGGVVAPAVGARSLFGAFAVLQAVGQMILGPMLFGLVYSATVAQHPKAIFILAAALLLTAIALLSLVRPQAQGAKVKRGNAVRAEVEIERGRSRVSKDLTGRSRAVAGTHMRADWTGAGDGASQAPDERWPVSSSR